MIIACGTVTMLCLKMKKWFSICDKFLHFVMIIAYEEILCFFLDHEILHICIVYLLKKVKKIKHPIFPSTQYGCIIHLPASVK